MIEVVKKTDNLVNNPPTSNSNNNVIILENIYSDEAKKISKRLSIGEESDSFND